MPHHDTPEFFRSYATAVGVKPSDPWWFLSGDEAEISRFTSRELWLTPATLIPKEERLDPLETHSHDLRIEAALETALLCPGEEALGQDRWPAAFADPFPEWRAIPEKVQPAGAGAHS